MVRTRRSVSLSNVQLAARGFIPKEAVSVGDVVEFVSQGQHSEHARCNNRIGAQQALAGDAFKATRA